MQISYNHTIALNTAARGHTSLTCDFTRRRFDERPDRSLRSFRECKPPFGNEFAEWLTLIGVLARLQVRRQTVARCLSTDGDGHLDVVALRHAQDLARPVAIEAADGMGAP